MSGPHSSDKATGQLYRLPYEPTRRDLEAMDRVLEVDAEAYLQWLETGEGPSNL